jgi:hypothetical protein
MGSPGPKDETVVTRRLRSLTGFERYGDITLTTEMVGFLRYCLVWPGADEHAKTTNAGATPRAQPESSSTGSEVCLLVLAVEEVVGRVWLKLSLTHRAGGSGGRSAIGV